MEKVTANNLNRTFLCRLSFTLSLILLGYEFFSHGLSSQLQNPSLIFPYADPTSLLFNIVGIPRFIVSHQWASLTFDSILFLSCIICILRPRQRFFVAVYIAFYFLYYIIYSSFGMHHLHSKVGAILIGVPFLFKGKSFTLMWEALRYYVLFFLSCAFFWKFFRGSWIADGHGVEIIMQNWLPILYQKPHHLFADFYYFLFTHPKVADYLFTIGTLAEGLFLIGFFTKRYDKLLALLMVLLIISFQIFTDAFMFELLILLPTLLFSKLNNKQY